MTTPVPAFPLAAQPSTPTPPPRRRGRLALVIVGALVLVAATAGATWWLTRPASTSSTPTAVASPTGGVLPIFGHLDLDDVLFSAKPGDACWGHRGYDDIRGGAQVTVTDSAGKVIGVGALDPGHVAYDSTGAAYTCTFTFVVTGVKTGGGFYGIEVAHRGRVQYAEEKLAAAIALTLG